MTDTDYRKKLYPLFLFGATISVAGKIAKFSGTNFSVDRKR